MATLKDRIKEQRELHDMTLKELSARIGVRDATIQRYESGEIVNVKHETICKMAEIFGVTPEYLMGWTDKTSRTTAAIPSAADRKILELLKQIPEEQKQLLLAQLEASVQFLKSRDSHESKK
jgi:transcriptional regulator with XRE-family HTH domain